MVLFAWPVTNYGGECVLVQANAVSNPSNPATPPMPNEAALSAQAQAAAMNAMRASMDSMRNMGSVMDMASPHHASTQQQQDAALRMHQAEALLRSQAEAALRLAVSQVSNVCLLFSFLLFFLCFYLFT